MESRAERLFKTGMQVLAIAVLVLMLSMIAHKGYVDISRLATEYSDSDFWPALVRYFFKNMAGG